MYIHICIGIYIYIHIPIHMHARTCIHTNTHMRTLIHTHLSAGKWSTTPKHATAHRAWQATSRSRLSVCRQSDDNPAYPTKAFVTHLTLAWHMLASHDAMMDVQPLRIAICRGVCAPFPASKGSPKSSITTSYDAYGKVLTHIC